jgi:NADH-quinone oxidoreductase subunit H
MFFLAEYIAMINVSAVAVTLFLGGWRMPAPISTVWPGANEGWWPILWFLAKVYVFLFVFVWIRGSLPRMRYDQFMRLGWRVLIPVAIGWVVLVAALRAIRNEYTIDTRSVLFALGGVLVVLAIGLLAVDYLRPQRGDDADTGPPEFDPYAGGYPVPPRPGEILVVTPRARATVTVSAAPVAAVAAVAAEPEEDVDG